MAEGTPMTDARTAIAARNTPIDPSAVTGWGVDADPANDPTYPYRDRAADEGLTSDWRRPPLQGTDVEILQSIEHIRRPAVFGTSTPPRGLSGVIRRGAFRYSESHWFHWLMLMGADRINVVEGVLEDLARGKIPNVPGEMGIRSELRYNKSGFARKVAVTALLAGGTYALLRARRARRERKALPAPA
jgi:hypothetical protein